MAFTEFAPPANKITIQLAPIVSGVIGTYADAGDVEQVTAWPVQMTESEAILVQSDAARLQREQPTHDTIGTFEAIIKFGQDDYAVNKAYADYDATTKRKNPCALKLILPTVDPAADATCVFQGWMKSVAVEPWQDGTQTMKYKIVFQATEPPTWTGLPS